MVYPDSHSGEKRTHEEAKGHEFDVHDQYFAKDLWMFSYKEP
jgi:hypothetical protein